MGRCSFRPLLQVGRRTGRPVFKVDVPPQYASHGPVWGVTFALQLKQASAPPPIQKKRHKANIDSMLAMGRRQQQADPLPQPATQPDHLSHAAPQPEAEGLGALHVDVDADLDPGPESLDPMLDQLEGPMDYDLRGRLHFGAVAG